MYDFTSLKHRGPDYSSFEVFNNVIVGFHRLAIVDDSFRSNQPFVYEDDVRTIVFICNGEIYNYKEIRAKYGLTCKNDCAVIPEVYRQLTANGGSGDKESGRLHEKYFADFIRSEVKGEFAFILLEFDTLKNVHKVVVGRDEIGVRPLYYSVDEMLAFASEIKGLTSHNGTITEFPPGYVYVYHMNGLGYDVDKYNFKTVYDTRFYQDTPYDVLANARADVMSSIELPMEDELLFGVRNAVINSVKRRLAADKPFAFLLSGGVDSSLVAALSSKLLGKPIRTFCCGMADGTDLHFARLVAKHIGSDHTEVVFTEQEGLDAIYDVVRTVETWDTTTVRASVGQYLVSKYIGCVTDARVVMVGEGPDEICSSYLYNWFAPNAAALDAAAKDSVENIHYYDVKRADRCISRWGLEGRVPLLDPEFIKAYWTIPAAWRVPQYKGIEKWWLRQAFDGLLPSEVLWRKKEAFSDGVSGERSWFKIIQEWVSDRVTDEEMDKAALRFPYCSPSTKEAYYYRALFCDMFGKERQEIIPGYWQPKWTANGVTNGYVDPSARTLALF
jgi:asparagine synthase (glutamine-hydrolysing)